jgi:hypothetical protein
MTPHRVKILTFDNPTGTLRIVSPKPERNANFLAVNPKKDAQKITDALNTGSTLSVSGYEKDGYLEFEITE